METAKIVVLHPICMTSNIILATAMTLQVFYIYLKYAMEKREKIVFYHARQVRPWSRLMRLSAQ